MSKIRPPFKSQKSCMRWVNSMGLDQRIDAEGGNLECLPTIASILIVQALVKKLCFELEPDREKAMNLFETICDYLHQWNLIEKIYETRDDLSTMWNKKSINLQIWGIIRRLPAFTHKPTTNISLLVESLVQLLWTIADPRQQKSMYSPRKICRFLCFKKIINKTYVLDEFEMIRNEYKRVLTRAVCVARGEGLPGGVEPLWRMAQHYGCESSRYLREFNELEQIACGAFGKVFKARHKMDGTVSAVKKTVFKWKSVKTALPHLVEVYTLASLDHPNIVPYKTAWIEPEFVSSQQENDDLSVSEYDQTTIFYNSTSTNSHRMSRADNSQSLCKYSNDKLNIDESPSKLEWVLFIQMTLCQTTLKELLEKRNGDNFHIDVMTDIFMQLLNALNYIHSRKIVHHDVKPSNIFVTESNGKMIAQLGDFGLACISHKGHTGEGFGTPWYAAPEQRIEGKCTAKSDVYSLGIILLELLVPFLTGMELARTIEEIRKGFLPENINMNFCTLLKRLINPVHKQRPSALQVIEFMNKIDRQAQDEIQQGLKQCNCGVEIKMLKEQLMVKDLKIEELRKEISEMKMRQLSYYEVRH